MSEEEKYQIVPFTPKPPAPKQNENAWDVDYFDSTEARFAIADSGGKVLDDAQGYGYKSRQKAHLALNWKYLGGRNKSSQRKSEFRKWQKLNPSHKEIVNKFHECMEINFKEIAKGEVTQKEIWDELAKEYSMEIPDFVKKEILK
jgi:hypothetical protein